MTMEGILPVWKPAGWTSHDVVAKVRRLIREKRVGHAGTLDPMVTGVLPLCVGRATRVVEYMQELPKAYEAVLELGVATDTEDLTGTVVEEAGRVSVGEDRIREVLDGFLGEISQVPPMYSAVKVDGKRLYELAREGRTVERQARTVRIHAIELLRFEEGGGGRPRIAFSVVCSKGTYIRTLCVDIGRALGVPAAMAELKRTRSAGFTEADCLTLEEIERLQADGRLAGKLLPAEAGVAHLPRLQANAAGASAALLGQKVRLSAIAGAAEAGTAAALFGPDGRFLGVFRPEPAAGLLIPEKVFS